MRSHDRWSLRALLIAVMAHHKSFFARRREKFASARPAFNRIHGLHLAGTLLSRERQRRNADAIVLR